MLTPRQHQAHSFICERIQSTGVAPTFLELQQHLGLASKSGVYALMHSLERRGYVRRRKFRARAVEVLRFPDGRPTHALATAFETLLSAVDAVLNHGADTAILRDAYERNRAVTWNAV